MGYLVIRQFVFVHHVNCNLNCLFDAFDQEIATDQEQYLNYNDINYTCCNIHCYIFAIHLKVQLSVSVFRGEITIRTFLSDFLHTVVFRIIYTRLNYENCKPLEQEISKPAEHSNVACDEAPFFGEKLP